jgi:hypothetical protein
MSGLKADDGGEHERHREEELASLQIVPAPDPSGK